MNEDQIVFMFAVHIGFLLAIFARLGDILKELKKK
jgi:hypothetical protein